MEMEKAYNPAKYEAAIYKLWEESGVFEPDLKAKGQPFSIILPPPNANGDLHLGHAMYVVEDILVRYHRMSGHPTLWLPGTDHAGIETQVVFERELAKQGKSRFDLGREEFYQQALAFTLNNQPKIISQLRSLGFSLDWSRLKFTLDPDIIEIVYQTFKQMMADDLIYRGNRIVNWCTNCRSSFADIEVKHVDQTDELYTLDYDTVQIATTRPETIFADVAVAVSPDDPRFSKLVGKNATVPLVDRPVPIIADTYVDPKFGTGALKITPGHDTNDYEIGRRHNLPEISVIDLEGRMINVPDELAGLTVTEARAKTLELLKKAGKLIKTTPLTHAVGTHERCGTIIEPLITEQWFLRIERLNQPVIKAIESDEVKIVPGRFKKVALDWLRSEHDWNISRQNWFGIRIPIYYKTSNDPTKDAHIFATSDQAAEAYYGKDGYRAETDTFDTWFSSGQWPYATLTATGDFDRFYPSSVMETGRDILTKWVTKMVLFGLYRSGKVPFHTVYLHGLVNDAQGQKMSKSKGNVINPLDMTTKYGTDALRLALITGVTPGNDGSLSEEKIVGYRNFCNKLWNVARFTLGKAVNYSPTLPELKSEADHWMATRLNEATDRVTKSIETLRFSDAAQTVYQVLWNDLADVYLEASKQSANVPLLVYFLETILKLTHPFAPFVSEQIWQHMAWQSRNLINSPWPDRGELKPSQSHTDSFAAKLAARALADGRSRLEKELKDKRAYIKLLESRVADPGFAKASAQFRDDTKTKLEQARSDVASLDKQLKA